MDEARTVAVSRCYDGMKVCPFFAWDMTFANEKKDRLPTAQCGAYGSGYLCWKPRDPVRVDPHDACPLRAGPVTVRFPKRFSPDPLE